MTEAGSNGEAVATRVTDALARGYDELGRDPDEALDDLTDEVAGLDRAAQQAQLEALVASGAFARGRSTATSQLDDRSVNRWSRWFERSRP